MLYLNDEKLHFHCPAGGVRWFVSNIRYSTTNYEHIHSFKILS